MFIGDCVCAPVFETFQTARRHGNAMTTIHIKDIAWIFVCQSGRLEREACVLAASLRRNLGPEANLIAAVPLPESVMGTLTPSVTHFLESQGVALRSFSNPTVEPGRELTSELLMNKAFALKVEPDASVVVFLDSDQICHSLMDLNNLLVPLVARRAFYPGAKATQGVWERAYEICDTQMPAQRISARSRVTSDPVIVCPPFFNSGFISLHRPWVHEFVLNYADCYRRIVSHGLLGENRYYEEQMAMAIAVVKTRVPYEIDIHRIDMALFHYYSVPRLASFKQFAQVVRELAEALPGLKEMLEQDIDWQSLLRGVAVNIRRPLRAESGNNENPQTAR